MNEYAGLNIRLSRGEFERLSAMAQRDLRHPRDQARYLLRQALSAEADDAMKNANRGAVDVEAQRAAVAA
ncbi:MAG: hypothetical protein QM346_08900 [Chloroflexota bacterium]|nr:hypothetical protein [Chloroflexota bacterium]